MDDDTRPTADIDARRARRLQRWAAALPVDVRDDAAARLEQMGEQQRRALADQLLAADAASSTHGPHDHAMERLVGAAEALDAGRGPARLLGGLGLVVLWAAPLAGLVLDLVPGWVVACLWGALGVAAGVAARRAWPEDPATNPTSGVLLAVLAVLSVAAALAALI